MKTLQDGAPTEGEKGMSLERIIAVGVFGWLALGVVLMGLDIW